MKKIISHDERIDAVRYGIYVKLFWIVVIGENLAYVFDFFAGTYFTGIFFSNCPIVLAIWMAVKGVLFNGTDHFPGWCWLLSFAWGLFCSIIIFVIWSTPDSGYYVENMNMRVASSIIAAIIYFIIAILFFYIVYRIAKKKITKLSYED